MTTIGVLLHADNPTIGTVVAVARAAEDAGADWFGAPDAFWWRDTWVLLAEAGRATGRIRLGPAVTNPYLRHPFHTVAALATLQEIAGPRAFLGLGAGGAEATGAAKVSRADAPQRIRDLAGLVRRVAGDAPLDEPSGRRLEVPLAPVPVLVAGRGDGVLRAAGAVADEILLWAVPHPDLTRSVRVVTAAAAGREDRPRLLWAPVVASDPAEGRSLAGYSVLNSSAELHARWGLDAGALDRLRATLVREGGPRAGDLVPDAAVADLVLDAADVDGAAAIAAQIGASGLAVRAASAADVPGAVAWARKVLAAGEST